MTRTHTVAILVVGALVATSVVVTGAAAIPSGTDSAFAQVEASEKTLVVTDLQAPEVAKPGTEVVVTATIENRQPTEVESAVDFRLEGEGEDLVFHQPVTVEGNGSVTVEFTLNTTGLSAGTYIHGVTTADSSRFATLDLSEEATVDFDEQESNGTTVVVDSVFVPDGGYVAIHDERLLDGDAVGSVVGVSTYLEPGFHEEVQVTLFDVEGAAFDDDRLTENQTLIAMPHLETGDNQVYEFVASDGEADGPYVSDGTPVTEAGEVTIVEDEVAESDGPSDESAADEADGSETTEDDSETTDSDETDGSDDSTATNETDDSTTTAAEPAS